MIRPELVAALRRWQEVLAGGALAGIGIYWIVFGSGLMVWVGWPVAGLGLAAAAAGVQRLRFHPGADGPGVVQVVEGRISYFGPDSGGMADLAALTALILDHGAEPPAWQLHQPGQPPLSIPLSARGADALFDAFASLPGIRTGYMLRQMQAGPPGQVVIWRAEPLQRRTPRLH